MRARTLRPLDALFPILALLLLWPIVTRYERPVEDRDFGAFAGGSADFASYYQGSRAVVLGVDPYLNTLAELSDPPEFAGLWRRELEVDGVVVTQYYLPGHYLAFAPLAWIYGKDWESAARTFFRLHLALLVLLAWIVARSAGQKAGPESRDAGGWWRLWGLALILFGLQVGARMGLERGQSDVVQAVLLWGGVACAAQGWMFGAAFLLVAGTLFKGYGVLLIAGLGLACLLGRKDFKAFLLGALAAGLPILVLSWSYFFTGVRIALLKTGDFSYHWTIHSFKHVGWAISPALAEPVRLLLTVASLVAAAVCWNRYRLARAASPEESTARLVVAATVSIAAMLGFAAGSAAYNLVLILPGLVWIAVLMRTPDGPLFRNREALFSAAMLLIVMRTPPLRLFAPAAYGLTLLVLWCLASVRPSRS